MRHYLSFAFIMLLLSACRKDKVEKKMIDWTAELKDSKWTAEIQYTQGPVSVLQYGAIEFLQDNYLRMTDSRQVHFGTWTVVDSTLNIDFTGLEKVVQLRQNEWRNFQNSSADEFNFLSVTRSIPAAPSSLGGSVWRGTLYGQSLKLEFIAGQKVIMSHPNVNAGSETVAGYTITGSGIKFASVFTGVPSGVSYFGCLTDTSGSVFRGLTYNVSNGFFSHWMVTRQ